MNSSRSPRLPPAALVAVTTAVVVLLALIQAYFRTNREQTVRLVLEDTVKRLAAEMDYDERVISARGSDLRRRTQFYTALRPVQGMVRAIQGGGIDREQAIPLTWWRTNLQQLFADAIRFNPDIIQLRFIGIADGGRELVRVVRGSNGAPAEVTPEADLRPRGDRIYFVEALKLEGDEIYVSAIRLARRTEGSSEPDRATVRVSAPVTDPQGRPFGVMVASFDFTILGAELEWRTGGTAARRHLTYLVDESGGYILNPQPGRAFQHDRTPGSPGWNEEFSEDSTVSATLGVPLPPGLKALRGPEGTVIFGEPAEVRLGSPASPIRLQLWQGLPLEMVAGEIRSAIRPYWAAAGAMSCAVLAVVGLGVAGFQRRQAMTERQFGDRLNRATRAGRVGTWELDVLTGNIVWNNEWTAILGTNSTPYHGRPAALLELVHPEDRGRMRSLAAEIASKHEFNARFRVVRPDGTIRFVSILGATEFDRQGRLVRLIGTGTDQTEIRQAEGELRESESKYRQVTESLPQLVWTCQPDGPCDYLSPQWVEYTGISDSSQLGYGWLEQLHPDDRKRAIDHWMATTPLGKIFEIDFRIRRHDGAYRWFHTLARPLRDAEGKITKWFGSNTDITALREAEQFRQTHLRTLECLDGIHVAINRSHDPEEMPQRVVESVLAMFPCDGATLIHPCDPQSGTWNICVDRSSGNCALTTVPNQPLLLGTDAQALFGAFAADDRAVVQCGPDGGRDLPVEFSKRFGAKSVMMVRISPTAGDAWVLMIRRCGRAEAWSPDYERNFLEVGSRLEGGLSSLLLFRQISELNSSLEARVQDRTMELTQLNEELLRSNGDLERFAFAASHDLKSPLKAVASLAKWLEEDLGDCVSAESRKHFDLLRRRVGRMDRLLDDLLCYSRAGRVREAVGEIPVKELFSDAVGLVDIPPGFTVKLVKGGPRHITTAITPVCTILTNLIVNAIRHHDRPVGSVEVSVEEADDRYRISVSDDGPGIPVEFREQIWEMFQTIRPRDRVEGSGMGLAMVRRLASSFGGRAELEPREPHGSIFRIVVPKVINELPPGSHGV